ISTWHGVKVDNSGFVTELKLPNNNLTGSVPDDIENLTHLRVLDFSGNKFNNNISSKIGNLANLDSLSLRNAKLTGTIPTELSNLAALKYLYLDNNTLVGPIPDKFGDLKNLLVLYINSNDLSGEIPTTLGNLRQLQQIYARDNVLSGPIPYALANIPALNTFVFDNNHLSGTLPDFSNTSMRTFLIHENPDLTGSLRASESVSEGHPDKVADQISDAILDNYLSFDPDSKVACETLVTTGQVILAGEINSKANINIQKTVRTVIKNIGYTKSEYLFEANSCGILSALHEQSPDINQGVDKINKEDQGAGDQGMMFGYASSETDNFMPLSLHISNKLLQELARIRKKELDLMPYLRPDAKAQVSVEYNDSHQPIRIHTIVISTQHDEFASDTGMKEKI
ncbi:unnamed protein product, partial [Darwinula stevensoni]